MKPEDAAWAIFEIIYSYPVLIVFLISLAIILTVYFVIIPIAKWVARKIKNFFKPKI